jgi:hypothetical protein
MHYLHLCSSLFCGHLVLMSLPEQTVLHAGFGSCTKECAIGKLWKTGQ